MDIVCPSETSVPAILHAFTSRNALPNLNMMMNQLPAQQRATGATNDAGVTTFRDAGVLKRDDCSSAQGRVIARQTFVAQFEMRCADFRWNGGCQTVGRGYPWAADLFKVGPHIVTRVPESDLTFRHRASSI